MKNRFFNYKKILASLLSFSILSLTYVSADNGSSFVVGDTYKLSDNIIFTSETIVDNYGGKHKSFVIDYTPSESLNDISFLNGKSLNTRTSVSDLVKENATDHTPVAAMNADFFNMSTGLAESLVIVDGKLLTSDRDNYAFAFDTEGTPFIDKPDINISLSMSSHTGTILHFNKEFSEYGLYLYSNAYGSSTRITVPTTELVLIPFSEELDYEQMAALIYGEEGVPFDLFIIKNDINDEPYLNSRYKDEIDAYANENEYVLHNNKFYKKCSASVELGSTIHAYVSEIRDNSEGKSLQIPEGCFVLAANKETQSFKFEKTLVDEFVEIEFKCNERFIGINNSIGCGALIVDNGEIIEHSNLSHYSSASPRTAIGITADGRVIMMGVDGRQAPYSKGLTLKQLSEEMLRLGCISAANLDGGGSTVVKACLPYSGSFLTVNKPSDGTERKVSNAIAFYNTELPTNEMAYSYLISDQHLVLNNSTLPLGKPAFADSKHYAVLIEEEVQQSEIKDDSDKFDVHTDDEILNELLDYSDSTKDEFEDNDESVQVYNYHGFTYSVDDGKGSIVNNIYVPDGFTGEVVVMSNGPEGYSNEAFKIISLSEIDEISIDFDKTYIYVGDEYDVTALASFRGLSVAGTNECFQWMSNKAWSLDVTDNGHFTAKSPEDKVTVTVAFGQTFNKIELEVRELPFVDISENWAKDNIIALFEEGVSNGEITENGRMYFPSRSFTRNEFCVMLSRMLGLTKAVDSVGVAEASEVEELSDNDLPESENLLDLEADTEIDISEIFDDYINIPLWAVDSVKILYSKGMLKGFEHTSDSEMLFDGSSFVTRREVIRLVGNLLDNAPDDFSFKYSDIREDDPDYQYIRNALYHGIFNGYLDGTLRLDTTLTRAEVSAVFVRLIIKI